MDIEELPPEPRKCPRCPGMITDEGYRTCGRCPQRRATDTEVNDAQERSEELQRCKRESCGAYLKVSETDPPRVEVLCLECYKESKTKTGKERNKPCGYPKHKGAKEFPVEYLTKCAVKSTARTSFGVVRFPLVCPNCMDRYRLQSKEDWFYDHSDYDPESGEIIPPLEQTGELHLYQETPRIYDNTWAPESVTVTRDGSAYPRWVVMDPVRFIYWRIKGKPHRAITADYLADGSKAMVRGTVYLPSLNKALDAITDLGKGRGHSSIARLGKVYVRAIRTNTETIGAYVVLQRDHSDMSFSEWLQYCHETGE